MTRRILVLVGCVALVLASLLAAAQPAQAAALIDQAIVIDCAVYSLSGQITFQATRDTTGSGSEIIVEEVTDGVNVLSTYPVVLAVGSSTFISGTAFLPAFQANPVTYRLFSPAGNGFPEQTIFTLQVICDGLPFAGACGVPDAGYQAVLTGSAILYWEPGKPTEPNIAITGGNVVMVYSIDDNGWAKIKWACGTYYIKASWLSPNPAVVSKPFLSTRK